MGKLRNAAFTLILLTFTGLSCYFFYSNIFTKNTSQSINQSKPDMVIHDISSVGFNSAGQISSKIDAPELIYDTYNRQGTFQSPHIVINQKNGSPWIITSDSGSTDQSANLYKLIGNVLLIQGATTKTKGINIATSELTIYPDKHFADTKEPITFTQINSDNSKITVTSVGASANQQTGEVKLFSQAHGVYNEK